MGMLGAMAGFGSGLQDFSQLLNEKSKMDWQEKQASIRYEREKSLESLRMQNQRANTQYADDLATKRQGQQNEFQIERYGIEKEDRNADIKYADDLARQRARDEYSDEAIAGKTKMWQAEAGIKQGAAVNQAVAIANATFDLDKKKRAEKLEEIRSTEMFNGASPEEKKLIEMSIVQPEMAKIYIESVKANQREFPVEQARLAIESGQKQYYENLSEDQQTDFKKTLKKEFGQSFTDVEAAGVMGRMNLEKIMQSTGKGQQQPKQEGKQIIFDPQQSINIQNAYKSGELSLGEIREKTKGTPYESVYNDLLKSPRKESNTSGVLSSVANSVTSFATRNTSANQQALNELKRKYPNMSDTFYRMKLEEMK